MIDLAELGGALVEGTIVAPPPTARIAAYEDGTGLATAQCRTPGCQWMLRGCGDLLEAAAVAVDHARAQHRVR